MLFTKENETLYLSSWEYNSCLIINELAKIVIAEGGRVKPRLGKSGYIVNRYLTGAIRDVDTKLEKMLSLKSLTDIQKEHINDLTDKLHKYKSINNEPIPIEYTTYISFILDDYYYYYQMEENPLFDFYFQKAPVINGEYSRDYYSQKDEKCWLLDCYLKGDCTEEERKIAANIIFNMLVKAPLGEKYIEKKEIRVANIYNDSYHYETIIQPERKQKVDF
jgi:hypothetical protein